MLKFFATFFFVAAFVTGCATRAGNKPNLTPNSQSKSYNTAMRMKLINEGKALSISRECSGCHSDNGEELSGPSFSGLWGLNRIFEDGSHQVVDAAYLKESMIDHNRKIVGGYSPASSIREQPPLNDREIDALVEYIADLGLREQMQDNLISSFTELDFDRTIVKSSGSQLGDTSAECATIKELLDRAAKSRDCASLSRFMVQVRDFNFRRIRTVRSRFEEVSRSVDWALHQGREEVLKFAVSEQERISPESTNYYFDLVLTILDEIAVHDADAHQEFLNPWILAGKKAGPRESAAVAKLTKFVTENEVRIQEQRERSAEARRNAKKSKEQLEKELELKELTPFVRTLVQFKITREQERQLQTLAQSSKEALMSVRRGDSALMNLLYSAALETDVRKRGIMLAELRGQTQKELKRLNDIRFEVVKILQKEQYAHASWPELMIPIFAILLKRH